MRGYHSYWWDRISKSEACADSLVTPVQCKVPVPFRRKPEFPGLRINYPRPKE